MLQGVDLVLGAPFPLFFKTQVLGKEFIAQDVSGFVAECLKGQVEPLDDLDDDDDPDDEDSFDDDDGDLQKDEAEVGREEI